MPPMIAHRAAKPSESGTIRGVEEAEANQGAGQMQQSLKDVGVLLIADPQAW